MNKVYQENKPLKYGMPNLQFKYINIMQKMRDFQTTLQISNWVSQPKHNIFWGWIIPPKSHW